MPISSERFERLTEGGVPPGTNADRILEFLCTHNDYAFRMTEIAEETGIPRGSVGPTLSQLEADGLVDHRQSYWRISASMLASEAARTFTNDTAATHDDGKTFNLDAWAESAEDERSEQLDEV